MKPRCADCRFYEPVVTDGMTHGQYGECRRYARRPESGLYGWPGVPATDWCGEFESNDVRHLEPDPLVEVKPDPIAAAAAELVAFIKERIALCQHGTIDVTCGACLAAWLPR